MSFTTEQFKQLYQALLSAFPNVGELKIFARTELGQDLDQIAGGNTLAEVVFALIQWADAEGRSDELVRLANQKKPKNPLLSLFATQYFNLSATPTQKDGTAGETRAPEDAMQGQIAPKAEHFPSRFDLKGVLIGCLFTITVVTLVIAGFTFIHLPFQRPEKAFSCQIMANGPLVSLRDDLQGKLQVMLDGKPANNINLLVVRMFNSGSLPIKSEDFVAPVGIDFGPGTKVIDTQIAEAPPNSVGDNQGDNRPIYQYENSIQLAPVLFNSGDGITIKVYYSGPDNAMSIGGRIVGVKEISYIPLSSSHQGSPVLLPFCAGFICGLIIMGMVAFVVEKWRHRSNKT